MLRVAGGREAQDPRTLRSTAYCSDRALLGAKGKNGLTQKAALLEEGRRPKEMS